MKFGLYSVALRNLKRKSFRTVVLIFSIGLLVSILVFGTSFIMSVGTSLERAADRLGADLLVVPVGARDYAEEMLLETKVKIFYMDRGIVDKVKRIEGVKSVTTQTYLETILGVCCDIPAAKVVAFDQESDFIVSPWLDKVLGRKLKKGEAIIGSEAMENLGLLDVGSSVLFGSSYTFAGVLEKTGTGLDNAIFIAYENIEDVLAKGSTPLRPNEISLIFVKVEKGYDPYQVGRKIEGEMIEVDIMARSDMGKEIITTLKDIKAVFLITIAMSLVLSTFLAWTIFTAIVNERSKEVAIMRALGAKGSHIVRMFFIEVFMLGFAGSLAGIVFGTYLSITLSRIFVLLRDTAATLTLAQRMEVALIGFVAGTGICIVGALSSIIRLKKLQPLNALKEA